MSPMPPAVVVAPLAAALALVIARAWRERHVTAASAGAVLLAEFSLFSAMLFTVPGLLAFTLGAGTRSDGTGLLDITVLVILFVPTALLIAHARRLGNCGGTLLWTWTERVANESDVNSARHWALIGTFVVLAVIAPYTLRGLWVLELLDYSRALVASSREISALGVVVALGAPLLLPMGAIGLGTRAASQSMHAAVRLAALVAGGTLVAMLVHWALPLRADLANLRIVWWDVGVPLALGALVLIGWRQQAQWVRATTRVLETERDAAAAGLEVAQAERAAMEAEAARLMAQVDLKEVIDAVRAAESSLDADPQGAASVLTAEIARLRSRVVSRSD